MAIERATIEKQRVFPEWLLRAIAHERSELATIADERKRRLAEVELSLIEDRVKASLQGEV